jgi:hypothetical protein
MISPDMAGQKRSATQESIGLEAAVFDLNGMEYDHADLGRCLWVNVRRQPSKSEA